MTQEKRRVTLGPVTVDCRCYLRAFFRTPTDEYAVMLPFMEEGQSDGNRAVHIVDQNRTAECVHCLTNYGIDVDGARGCDIFELRPWEEARLRGVRFDRDFAHGE